MLTLARNKFFNRYLPLILSVVLVVVGLGSYFLIRNAKKSEASWFSSSSGNWNYRQKIVIDHTKVSTASSTTLSNFPVLISTTNVLFKSSANGGHVTSSSGNDILFTSSDGLTKLNHEIESYASTTGQLIAWVNAPSLSPITDTVLYMYYGGPGDTSQQNATGVWDSNYKGIWHLPDGSNLTANDSTGVNNGTLVNAPTATTGQIDGAANFGSPNTTKSINVGHDTSQDTGSTFTIEAWVNPASVSARYGVYTTRSANSSNSW